MVSAGVELSCRTGQAPQALLRRPRSSFPGNHLAAPGLRQCSARTASRRRGLPLRPAATAAAVTLTAPAPEEPPSASNGAAPLPVPSQADAQPKAPEPALFSDAWKEAQRKDMRQVFDYERWKMHRSSGRYMRHVAGLADSRIVGGLVKPLAYVAVVSCGVMAYNLLVEAGKLPLWPILNVAANAPFGLTSFALSLLLVFRTNASYGRFDEARKLWGLIVNQTRNVVRLAEGYLPSGQSELKSAISRWTIAFPKALMCHIREGESLQEELRSTLKPEELAGLLGATHRPLYVCQQLTNLLRAAQLAANKARSGEWGGEYAASMAAFRMDEGVGTFTDVAGACERLLRTPIPLSYTRHTSRFMMIWLTLLPFTLWTACRWAMLPITLLVAFLLLGIEEIGVSIEEPFSILPLEAICRTIESNVLEIHAVGPEVQAQTVGA